MRPTSWVGSEPESELSNNRSSCKCDSRPSCDGTVPLTLQNATASVVSELKKPISVGSVPETLRLRIAKLTTVEPALSHVATMVGMLPLNCPQLPLAWNATHRAVTTCVKHADAPVALTMVDNARNSPANEQCTMPIVEINNNKRKQTLFI